MNDQDRTTAAADGLLEGIDYRMLRDQKFVLLAVIDHFRKGSVIHDGPDTRTAVAEAMEGLLHLIDAVQDTADAAGLMPADGWLSDDSDDDPALSCDRCGKQVPEGEGWYTGDGDERVCRRCADAAVPQVWRSTDDPAADDWTIESPDGAVCGPLVDIAGRLPRGDYYLGERGDGDSWAVVTADGSVRIAQCPTEEEAVALIMALRD